MTDTTPEPTTSEPTTSEPTTSEPTTSEPTHDQVQEQLRAAIRSQFSDVDVIPGLGLVARTRIDGEDVKFAIDIELI